MINYEKYGFNKTKDVKHKYNNVFVKRIHDLIYLEGDEFGFITMVRKTENTKTIHKVMIPKKVSNNRELKTLLAVIGGL